MYQLLEAAELKGALDQLSAVRPYSRSRVVALLDRLWEARKMLSGTERAVLEKTMKRFGEDRTGLPHGNIASRPSPESEKSVAVGVDVLSDFRLNANSPSEWHLDSALRPYLRGDLGSWLSYLGILGFTFDRVRSEEAFPPYGFSKQWDGYHISFSEPRFSLGDLDYPTISYDLGTEIAVSLPGDDLQLGIARQRREWGVGDGSLTLGGTARPFAAVETHVDLAPWITGHHLIGSLGNSYLEPQGTGGGGTLSFQKLFALQRLELFPLPWLYLSATSAVVGARRFELTYLSPLLFGVLAQNLIGDLDNVGVGVDLAFRVPPIGKAYFSFYADEMEITNLAELFTRPRNMFALQGGLKVPVPWLPFTSATLQYTKIEPFTYAHYPTWYPDYRIQVDTSYTHDGLYDYNHIVTLSGEYAIPNTPVTVALSYTFSYTHWEVNESGETDPGDTMRNIIALKVKVFR